MKRTILTIILIILSLYGADSKNRGKGRNTDAAASVIERLAGARPENIRLKIDPNMRQDGCDAYRYHAVKGHLTIEGSSQVALCKGFYDYIIKNGYGVMTWSGSRCVLPESFPDCGETLCISPFKHHLFYNVCTNGYSTAYWTWKEWEREIDWLALHGFDMPLAPVAGEAIFARVWRSMGLSETEIDEYFTGPGHMPWMRMGNMTGLDGSPTEEWHDAQILLQHKIIEKMRALEMKPVFQGFAGFVPKALKSHYPDALITSTKWSGFENYMLSPTEALFAEIQKRFISEWEKEFGKGEYYLIDCFNELEIDFGKKGSPERSDLLRKYSSKIYEGLSTANPEATWVMQGWMFGYQRDIWDPESAEALLSGVPDEKMLLIDLAVDFNRFIWQNRKSWEYLPGMCGKPWIYSTTPNFGGRTALIGNLESYMNGHIEALESQGKGNLDGYGSSPEGIEQNEPVYEVIADAGWRSDKADLREFLKKYSIARYGSCPDAISVFWENILKGPYGTCTNNARYLWQMRPVNPRVPAMGIDRNYYKAIESFLSCAEEMKDSRLYVNDALAYSAMYLAAKADEILKQINRRYVFGLWKTAAGAYVGNAEKDSLDGLESKFMELLETCDRLLESHPLYRLERWLEMAGNAGQTDKEREKFEMEQRRLVSVWGGPFLYDYSARLWSGLIRDFYIPRWERYFKERRGLENGTGGFVDHKSEEEKFHIVKGLSPANPFPNPLEAACKAVDEASSISFVDMPDGRDYFGYICSYDFNKPMIWKTVSVFDSDLRKASSISVEHVFGKDTLYLHQINFKSHNDRLGTYDIDKYIGPGEKIAIPLKGICDGKETAKEINIQFIVKGKTMADASLVMNFL